jgi:hypothetical protein
MALPAICLSVLTPQRGRSVFSLRRCVKGSRILPNIVILSANLNKKCTATYQTINEK